MAFRSGGGGTGGGGGGTRPPPSILDRSVSKGKSEVRMSLLLAIPSSFELSVEPKTLN